MKKKKASNLERQTFGIFWQAIKQTRLLYSLSLFFYVGVICINILVPLLISMAIAGLVVHGTPVTSSLLPLAIIGLIGLGANLAGITASVRASAHTQNILLEKTMDTLLRRSVGFHTNNIGGKLVSNALEYSNAYGRLFDTVFAGFIPFALTMIIGAGVVISRSLPIGLALLAITIVTIVLTFLEGRRRAGLRQERKKAQNKMVANFSDTIVNATAVKTFASEHRELYKHRVFGDKLTSMRLRDWTLAAINGNIRIAILLGLQFGFIAYMGYLIKQDPTILGIGIFAFTYTLSLSSKLFEVGSMIRSLEEGFLHAASMTEIMLEPTEINDAPNAKKLSVKKGNITLDHIDFSYSDAKNEHIFHDLSLDIKPGQKVGVVGPSGGGKSTLTRLLLRFEDINSGAITIDQQDIRKVTQASLHEAIAYVPQEPILFHRSVRENIAYAQPDASQEQIERAAKLAFAHEFIKTLPDQYDTIVGERGVKLSGGQRQRIAIARAILKNAPILILDEATSALDSESEVYIQKALTRLMKGRTTLVVAHRLSTIQTMDRIIVIDKGAIIEDGTHQELLKNSKLYAKLWSHQSGGFIEE